MSATSGGLSRNWHLLPRAMAYVRPHRREAGTSLLLTLLLALATLAQPWPLAYVIDTIVGEGPPGWVTDAFGTDRHRLVLIGTVGILLTTVLVSLLTVADEFVTTRLDLRVVFDLRRDLFRHALRMSPSYLDDRDTGGMMYRINNEADSLGHIVLTGPDVLRSSLTIVGMLIVALRIDVALTLVSLAVVPFVVWSTAYYANRIEPHVARTRRLELTTLAIVHDAISMARVIVAFGRERHEQRRFREQGEQAIDARIRLRVREAGFRLVVSGITACGTAAVLGFGAYQATQDRITPGQLLIMLTYVAAVYDPLRVLTNSVTSLQQRLMALRAMVHLLDTPPDVVDRPDAIDLARVEGRITFEHVAFAYPSRPQVVRDVSFEIEPRSTVAIVGPTGAGKSTVASLIPRHFEVADGAIRIDGLDVRDVSLESVRRQFAIVLQEPVLFADTIGNNIRYGRVDADQDAIERAARSANAHRFISALPDGYDTPLGERGARLSGGERQRIAVARAFLRDAPILILDEPTSSIDSRTEAEILSALKALSVGRTTITIAHRLATIRDADLILVMDGGRVVEQGTFDDLVDGDGLFHQLWEAQALKQARIREARRAVDGVPSTALTRPI